MAKLQIFVLIVALSQAYGAIEISTLPGLLPANPVVRPDTVVVVPDVVTPPCVASVRALLEAILSKLPSEEVGESKPLPVPLPTPEDEKIPEIVLETPCSACFEHINSLLTTAEKVIAIRKMSTMMRF